MGRMAGHFEWDDDDLRPGNKKEGGLSDNLYDDSGKLSGRGRFVPSGEDDEPLEVTEYVYVPVEARRDNELAEQIGRMLGDLLSQVATAYIDAVVAPAVSRWWQDSAKPAVKARIVRRTSRTERRRTLRLKADELHEPTSEPAEQLPAAPQQDRPKMSSAEAQARFIAAASAQAYAAEQLRLIQTADIVGAVPVVGETNIALIHRIVAALPAKLLQELAQTMWLDPSLLTEENLAQLASVLAGLPRHELDT